jgi:hypothetical protein
MLKVNEISPAKIEGLKAYLSKIFPECKIDTTKFKAPDRPEVQSIDGILSEDQAELANAMRKRPGVQAVIMSSTCSTPFAVMTNFDTNEVISIKPFW